MDEISKNFIENFIDEDIAEGGLLNNLTTIKTNKDQNFKLDQKDSASVWFKTVFDETGMNYFIADFIYDFERAFAACSFFSSARFSFAFSMRSFCLSESFSSSTK